MAEIERTRERERPPLQDNTYERSMRARAEWTQRNLTGPVVVKREDASGFRHGKARLLYYLCPVSYKEIRSATGACSCTRSRPSRASTRIRAAC